MAAPGPWWRSVLWSSLAGAGLAILGIAPGMGLPGALALAPAAPVISAVWGVPAEHMFPQDSAWPFAIIVTFLLGPLVPALWLATGALRLSGLRRALAMMAGMALGGVLMALLAYALGVAPLLA